MPVPGFRDVTHPSPASWSGSVPATARSSVPVVVVALVRCIGCVAGRLGFPSRISRGMDEFAQSVVAVRSTAALARCAPIMSDPKIPAVTRA